MDSNAKGSLPDESECWDLSERNYSNLRSQKRRLLEEQRKAWEAGEQPLPESYLDSWPTNPRKDPDSASVLYEDLLQRRRRGEDASADDYAERFPDSANSLKDLLSRRAVLGSLGSPTGSSITTLGLPEVGDQIFDFRLVQELGHGAFARVFLARQGELADRPVVLKISALEGSEPQTLAQLQHTHIVPIYSVHEDFRAGLRAVCMPYFGGASLSRVLEQLWTKKPTPDDGKDLVIALEKTQSPPPLTVSCQREGDSESAGANREEAKGSRNALELFASSTYVRTAAWIVARLAEGLQHAHERGVLHRDIKPSNILIASDGQPLLLDFNVAQNGEDEQTEATLGGTIAYMSPEHLQAILRCTEALARQVDHRSDIYSLGLVLFEMLAGQSPFEQTGHYSAPNLRIQAMAVERGRITPSLRARRLEVPWGLESIVRKCLAPNPAQRYQQAFHVAEDLQRFLDDRPLRFAPELSWKERVHKWVRRHPRLTSAGIVALVAGLLLLTAGLALASVRSYLAQTQGELSEAQARAKRQAFEAGTVRAQFLVNTVVPQEDHLRKGIAVCEETLGLYGVLTTDRWQDHSHLLRLSPEEREQVEEDVREQLLLLAGARVKSRPGDEGVLHGALVLLDRAEAIPGLRPSRALWLERARYLELLKNPEKSAAARIKGQEIKPYRARDHYELAAAHARKGNRASYQQALGELNRALELDPRHYWSYFQRGICHQELGNLDRATRDFGTCIGLWPDFPWAYFNIGYVLDQAGHKADAIREYTAAIQRDPGFVSALVNRGLAHLEVQQYTEALADFDRVRTSGRWDVVVRAGRGIALEGLRRFDEADAALGEALAGLAELSPPRRLRLRWAYGFTISGRQPEKARATFDDILREDPNNFQALYGCAMLAMGQGKGTEAIHFFDRAVEVNPGFLEARRYRAIMLARMGKLERATQEANLLTGTEQGRKDPSTLYAAACVAALAGEKLLAPSLRKSALDLLRRAADNGADLTAAGKDPDLAGLRSEPGFLELLQNTKNRQASLR